MELGKICAMNRDFRHYFKNGSQILASSSAVSVRLLQCSLFSWGARLLWKKKTWICSIVNSAIGNWAMIRNSDGALIAKRDSSGKVGHWRCNASNANNTLASSQWLHAVLCLSGNATEDLFYLTNWRLRWISRNYISVMSCPFSPKLQKSMDDGTRYKDVWRIQSVEIRKGERRNALDLFYFR